MRPQGVERKFWSNKGEGRIKGLRPRRVNVRKGKEVRSARGASDKSRETQRIRRGSPQKAGGS